MAIKFLDYTGLQKFWNKCKNTFLKIDAINDKNGLSAHNLHLTGSNSTTGHGLSVEYDAYFASDVIVNEGAVALVNEHQSVGLKCSADGKLTVNDVAVATVTDVASAVANAGHLKREIVTALPGVATAKENVIYMVSNSTTGDNKYDEYMLINGAFEKTGSSDVDLSGYPNTAITETEINALT